MIAIDVVMVAYRSEPVIAGAVEVATKLNGRVVVVDHGTGECAAVAARAGAVTVVDSTNPGFGAGQNRGLSLTGTEFVLLCNPDARIMAAPIARAVPLLRSRPEVAATQGVILNDSTGRPERSAGHEVTPWHLAGRALGARRLLRAGVVRRLAARTRLFRDHVHRAPAVPTEVESLSATVVLVRRTAFDEVGGFDPRFFLYGEDLDLCRRLRDRGYRLLAVPEVWATHQSGGSAESSMQRELHWWAGTMQFGAQVWPSAGWVVAVAAAAFRWLRLAVRHPRGARPAFRSVVARPLRWRREARHGAVSPVAWREGRAGGTGRAP